MPDTDTVRLLAAESTTTFFTEVDDAWRPEREQHGRLVTGIKPDQTSEPLVAATHGRARRFSIRFTSPTS